MIYITIPASTLSLNFYHTNKITFIKLRETTQLIIKLQPQKTIKR